MGFRHSAEATTTHDTDFTDATDFFRLDMSLISVTLPKGFVKSVWDFGFDVVWFSRKLKAESRKPKTENRKLKAESRKLTAENLLPHLSPFCHTRISRARSILLFRNSLQAAT